MGPNQPTSSRAGESKPTFHSFQALISQERQKLRRLNCSPRRSARQAAAEPLAAARPPNFASSVLLTFL
jgi:hypothetical protein